MSDLQEHLPEQIIELKAFRIKRDREKLCQCKEKNIEVDPINRVVSCGKCGAWIEPFEALLYMATEHENHYREVKELLAQRREIANYKPHLIVIRKLEERYRGRKMLPECPRCKQPFFFEEIDGWINREWYEKQRQTSLGDKS